MCTVYPGLARAMWFLDSAYGSQWVRWSRFVFRLMLSRRRRTGEPVWSECNGAGVKRRHCSDEV